MNKITKPPEQSEQTEKADKGFRFDSEHHRYYFDGKQMTGVTTILDVLAKPALIQWAANMAVGLLAEKGTPYYGPNDDLKDHYVITGELLEEARKAHAQKRDKSADIGTLAHAWIEKWINASMGKGDYPIAEPSLMLMTGNFMQWIAEKRPKFIESEKVVHSKEHWFAGTLDFVCEMNGKTYLGDIKTGNGIYQEMWFQTAGYQLALEECEPQRKIDGHLIVNITKDGKLNVMEHYDYETSKKAFLACLELYQTLNQKL